MKKNDQKSINELSAMKFAVVKGDVVTDVWILYLLFMMKLERWSRNSKFDK